MFHSHFLFGSISLAIYEMFLYIWILELSIYLPTYLPISIPNTSPNLCGFPFVNDTLEVLLYFSLDLAIMYFLSSRGYLCALLREGPGEPSLNLGVHSRLLKHQEE